MVMLTVIVLVKQVMKRMLSLLLALGPIIVEAVMPLLPLAALPYGEGGWSTW